MHPLSKKSMFDLEAESEPSSEDEVEVVLEKTTNVVLDSMGSKMRMGVRKSVALGMKPFAALTETEEVKKEKAGLENAHLKALEEIKSKARFDMQLSEQDEEYSGSESGTEKAEKDENT